MTEADKPRVVSIVVDNSSWVLPYAKKLENILNQIGDDAIINLRHSDVREGYAAFFLGCTKIAKPETLRRNRYNLVVHSSDLPQGRGWSPLTWQILEGKNTIPVCLFEAIEGCDEGDIFYRDTIVFEGHELIDELRERYGECSIGLCEKFMREGPVGREVQTGEPSFYERRGPHDSELDSSQSIASQFNLLRTVDNEKYPAFFNHRGHKYRLRINKIAGPQDNQKWKFK